MAIFVTGWEKSYEVKVVLYTIYIEKRKKGGAVTELGFCYSSFYGL